MDMTSLEGPQFELTLRLYPYMLCLCREFGAVKLSILDCPHCMFDTVTSSQCEEVTAILVIHSAIFFAVCTEDKWSYSDVCSLSTS